MNRRTAMRIKEWSLNLTGSDQTMELPGLVWYQILNLASRYDWKTEFVHPAIWSKKTAKAFAQILDEHLIEIPALLEIDAPELKNICLDYRQEELKRLIQFCRSSDFTVTRSRKIKRK